ncbi:MAG TPA: HAD-IA family hydrolase [Steroidobacteraceae bacterium]|jgi:putative hydrolase of the HAD superfamily|nr:HAD-IA family hydrolase [Steroidobacteraceae bacterium]
MNAELVLSFDLDDTLWAVEPVILAAEGAMLAWLNERHPQMMRGHDRESLRAMRARLAEQYPERSHDMTFLRHRALAEMFTQAGHDANHADEAFEVFFAARNRVTLYDEVEASLERLSARYRLFALSNGNADLQRCGIAHWFEGHITAISAGAAKPDARIYKRLLDEAGVAAAQVLHIGDDPQLDVMGATQAGLQAAWLNRFAKPWPKHLPPPARTIKTLEEIN